MPQGKQRQRSTPIARSTREVMKMTPEDRERLNADRSPSEQVSTTERCGAKRSPNTMASWSEEEVALYESEGIRPTCHLVAGYGTDHRGYGYCKHHGGNTPAGRKAGARAMGRAFAEQQKRSFGDKDLPQNNLTPEEALLEEVRRSVALVRWLEERIGMWEIPDIEALSSLPDEPTYKDEYNEKALGGLPRLMTATSKGTPMATDVQSWLIVYREERQHMVRVSKLAIDAGIAERMVRIAESQGQMLALAIRATLAALALTPDQHSRVPQVVPEILRQVSQGLPQITVNGEVIASV